MPYYDLVRASLSNAASGAELSHLWGSTVANQETVGLVQCLIACRFAVAGGIQFRIKFNSGAPASGGTAQTPQPRNPRAPAALSMWKNDATPITPGPTLVTRVTIGATQTGGGGWVAAEPTDKIMMLANATNPTDAEITSMAAAASVPFDVSLEFVEGT